MRVFWLWLLCAGLVHAEDFSRYQIVIDRSPFGPVSAANTVDVPQPLKRFQFVALVMSNGQAGVLQAIIHDQEANRSYFRAQGETLDGGVRVERIDLDPPKLVLKLGLETANLVFQDRPSGPAVAVVNPAQPAQPAQAGRPNQPNVIRRIPFRRGN
ncbi:MAG: hypothetical protein PCFJNLEI_02706 [Verrucomicrobiae bacterium]|nr:hypothetical protein [Verrucomicrobiae bacterium]